MLLLGGVLNIMVWTGWSFRSVFGKHKQPTTIRANSSKDVRPSILHHLVLSLFFIVSVAFERADAASSRLLHSISLRDSATHFRH